MDGRREGNGNGRNMQMLAAWCLAVARVCVGLWGTAGVSASKPCHREFWRGVRERRCALGAEATERPKVKGTQETTTTQQKSGRFA